MKNATGDLIRRANFNYEFVPNVVYNANFNSDGVWYLLKVHTRDVKGAKLAFEDMEGNIYIPSTFAKLEVYQEPKGPSQQPKRIKRKPVKGTKPEKLLPMSADVKLKVGDKVVLENGKRETIREADHTDPLFPYLAEYWYSADGKVTFCDKSYYGGENITHKIVPYEQWNAPSLHSPANPSSCQAGSVTAKYFEQEAFDKGHWCGHIATENSSCPCDPKERVEVLLRDGNTLSHVRHGFDWNWTTSVSLSHQIVAFRKTKQ